MHAPVFMPVFLSFPISYLSTMGAIKLLETKRETSTKNTQKYKEKRRHKNDEALLNYRSNSLWGGKLFIQTALGPYDLRQFSINNQCAMIRIYKAKSSYLCLIPNPQTSSLPHPNIISLGSIHSKKVTFAIFTWSLRSRFRNSASFFANFANPSTTASNDSVQYFAMSLASVSSCIGFVSSMFSFNEKLCETAVMQVI